MRRILCPFALFAVLTTALPAAAQQPENTQAIPPASDADAHAIYQQLRSPSGMRHGYALQQMYKERGYQPIWLEEDGDWEHKPDDFADAIEDAALEGLNPQDYPLEQLMQSKPALQDAGALARYELQVSDMVLAYIDDLHNGRVDPQSVFPRFFVPEDQQDSLAYQAQQVLQSRDVEEALRQQTPQIAEYARLRKALADYRAIAEQGGWATIPTGGVIKPGQADERIPAIRERLELLGRVESRQGMGWFDSLQRKMGFGGDEKPEQAEQSELSDADRRQAAENPAWVYGSDLEPAIREFQQRRGAKVDGVIGPETLAELNIPVEDRIHQIILSMEQWRWLPKDLGAKYVFVNTAGYYAKGVDNGRVVVDTPVIVGEIAHQTPSFSSYIPDVKFYPDWTVPDSIAKRYLLDKIRNNPSVVQSLGYELYNEAGEAVPLTGQTIPQLTDAHFPPYRFRQKPGPDNALGLVRFSVENDYAIYLHDTPKDSLFEETNRNFSSGCIRVGEPVKMAQFLLAGNSPLAEREIASRFDVAKGTDLATEVIPLETKIPVHIMYMTAWVDEGGNVRFESDAYGRDAKLKAAMGL